MSSSASKAGRRRSASKVREKKTCNAANTLAHALTEHATPSNMDLKVRVAGYTHRNGFKLSISNVEVISDNLIDEWKAKCEKLGYSCTVAYNAALSTAVLHASPPHGGNSLLEREDGDESSVQSRSAAKLGVFKPAHPLTLLAAVLFVLNFARHGLS